MQNSSDFDFLKPTHPLFKNFTSLVEAYSKIVNCENVNQDSGDNKVLERIIKYNKNPELIYTKGKERYQYEKYE